MKIYKFGGASVNSAEGVNRLARIVSNNTNNLVVVISAMGKTTNMLEAVVELVAKSARRGVSMRISA